MDLKEKLKVLSVLFEAGRSERGGEVVMRSGENSARAFFVGGRIAWVTVSSIKRTFTQYLQEKAGLKPEEVQEVFEECRRTRANFGETIVEWDLASEETLRRLLLEHLTECLVEVLSWDAVESMFVPEERSYRGSLTFTLEELLDSALRAEGSARLAFAGHSQDEILALLHSEREPTLPFMPAFFPDKAPAPEKEAPPTQSETEEESEPEPPPLRGKAGRSLLAASAIILLAAGSFWVLEYLDAQSKPEPPDAGTLAIPRDAGSAGAAAEPAPPADAGPAPVEPPAADATAAQPQDGGAPELETPKPASLRLTSRPAGALVYLDGVLTDKKTPCQLENLQPGSYLVLLERSGSAPAFKRIDLESEKQEKLHLKLPRRDRRFRGRQPVLLESEPPGAAVSLDKAPAKHHTPVELKLRLDRATQVTLELPGFLKWRHRVRPVPEKKSTVRALLEKENP